MKQRHPTIVLASLTMLGALLATILAACGGGSAPAASSGPVTLNYWYTEGTAETPAILQLIKQFEQQNPTIHINAQYQDFAQAQSKFTTAAQSNTAPDILRSDVGWVAQFASLRYLLPLDRSISQSDLSDYLPNALAYDKYKDQLYGLPQVTDFLALLYNKAAFVRAGISGPPTSMAQFEADAQKLVSSKTSKYGFETSGASYFALPFLWAYGGGMIDPNNTILVNNTGSVSGLNFLLKLQNQDKVMPTKVDVANGYNNMVNDLKNGTTGMIFDGPWETSNILSGSAFSDRTNLGIAGIPTGPTGATGSPTGGQSYVIYAGTRHPAEAIKFIQFMSSTASQVAIARANHTLPTRQSAYTSSAVSTDQVISGFYAVRSTAVSRPVIPQGGQLFNDFDPNIQAALLGQKSASVALNAVADAWKTLLTPGS
jgi:arabinogalactan oligomer/maltooligosaccharide transport system substrate-binding protein